MENFKQFLKKHLTKIIGIVFLLVISFVCYEFFFEYSYLFKDVNTLKEVILGYGNFSVIIFLLLQVLQVVVFIIPGEIFQVAGGYIFGAYYGFLLCIIGSIIGGAVNFYIARILGRPFIDKIISKKDGWLLHKLTEFNEDPRYEIKLRKLIFIFYLIPGIPKDLLGYICGVTKIRFKEYIIISNVAKVPALFVSTFFGHNIGEQNLTMLIVTGIVVTIVFGICVFKGKHWINKIEG